ncbi:MAG: hypothetical protein DRJ26_04645, partial [Candidatus Methanomethylicota archaeon]
VVIILLSSMFTTSTSFTGDIVEDPNSTPFIVDIGPIYVDDRWVAYGLYPVYPVSVGDVWKIELPDELLKTSIRMAILNALGIKHIGYWQFISLCEVYRYEEFLDYFNLSPENVGRMKLNGEWAYLQAIDKEVIEVHHAREHYQNYLVQLLKQMFDAGMSGVTFDGGLGDYYFKSGYNSFDPETMKLFNQYLASKYTSEELREKFGITDIDSFNFKEYLNNLGYYDDSVFEAQTFPSEPTARALWKELLEFDLVRLIDLYKKIRESVDSWEIQTGRKFIVLTNSPTEHTITAWGYPYNFLLLLPLVDGFGYEIDWGVERNTYPNRTELPNFRIITSLGKILRSWTLPESKLGLIAIAELIAVSAEEPEPEIALMIGNEVKRLYTNFSLLIQCNPQLYGQERYGQIALIYPMASAWYTTFPHPVIPNTCYIDFEGAYYLLEDSHYTVDIIVFGDNKWYTRTPTLSELSKYSAIVLSNAAYLTDDQVQLIIDYVKNGGTLIAIGDLGIYNEHGERVDRLKLEEMLEDTYETKFGLYCTVHSYGNGQVIHIPENIAWRYFFDRLEYNPEAKELLESFKSLINSVYPNEIETDLPDRVNIIRYKNDEIGNMVFYLVNYDWDFQNKEPIKHHNIKFNFKLPYSLIDKEIEIKVYTGDYPEGKSLPFTRDGEWIKLELPEVAVLTVIECRIAKPKGKPMIISEPTVIEGQNITLTGDLIIESDLVLINSEIIVDIDSWEPVKIEVLPGGSLTMINSVLSKVNGNYYVIVHDGAKLYMESSEVSKAGLWGPLIRAGFTIHADDAVIVNCKFHDNYMFGLQFYNVRYAFISNCEFYNNKAGISIALAGMIETVRNNFHDNNIGIYATDVKKLRIMDSVFASNKYLGLAIERTNNLEIYSTTVTGPSKCGVYARASCIKIHGSTVKSNEVGIFVDGSPLAIILSNKVQDNTKCGIYLNKIVSLGNFPWDWCNMKLPSLLCEGFIIGNEITRNGVGIQVENKEYYTNEFIRIHNNTISENQVGLTISNSVAKIYANNFINNDAHVGEVEGPAEFYYDFILAGMRIALKTIGNYWDDYTIGETYQVAPGYEDMYPLTKPAVVPYIEDITPPLIRIVEFRKVKEEGGITEFTLTIEAEDDTLLSGAFHPNLHAPFAFFSIWSPYQEFEHAWMGSSGELLPPEVGNQLPEEVLKKVVRQYSIPLNTTWLEKSWIAVYVQDMYGNWARNDTMPPHVAIAIQEPLEVTETDEVTVKALAFDWSAIWRMILKYYDGKEW